MQNAREITLLERTKALVEGAPKSVTYTVMANEIGVSVGWVSRLMAGKIPNPGVVHIQALHDYLAGLEA